MVARPPSAGLFFCDFLLHNIRMKVLAAVAITSMIFAQTRPPGTQETFENLGFSKGTDGQMPPGWHLGLDGTQVFTAKIVSGSSCVVGAQCAEVTGAGPGSVLCFLYHYI